MRNFWGIALIVLALGIMSTGCDNGLTEDDEYENNQKPVLTGSITVHVPYTFTLKVGNTIDIGTTNLGGTGTINYFWYRNDNRISGANGSSYTLTENDAGQYIKVDVGRSGNIGTVGYNFRNTVLPSTAPNLTGTVKIDGLIRVGQTISANISNLDGTGIVCYQWWRETGTNSWSWSLTDSNSTFLLTSAVLGQRIRLTVYRTGYYGVMNYTTSAVTD